MTWIREGECCKCGDCCTGNPFTTDRVDRAKGMCPLLSAVNDLGQRLCTVHDGDNYYWNNACKHWPSIPEHTAHLPRCTFTWREV